MASPVVSAHFRSLLFTNVSCVKTAEATDMSFEVWTARPSNDVLGGSPDLPAGVSTLG